MWADAGSWGAFMMLMCFLMCFCDVTLIFSLFVRRVWNVDCHWVSRTRHQVPCGFSYSNRKPVFLHDARFRHRMIQLGREHQLPAFQAAHEGVSAYCLSVIGQSENFSWDWSHTSDCIYSLLVTRLQLLARRQWPFDIWDRLGLFLSRFVPFFPENTTTNPRVIRVTVMWERCSCISLFLFKLLLLHPLTCFTGVDHTCSVLLVQEGIEVYPQLSSTVRPDCCSASFRDCVQCCCCCCCAWCVVQMKSRKYVCDGRVTFSRVISRGNSICTTLPRWKPSELELWRLSSFFSFFFLFLFLRLASVLCSLPLPHILLSLVILSWSCCDSFTNCSSNFDVILWCCSLSSASLSGTFLTTVTQKAENNLTIDYWRIHKHHICFPHPVWGSKGEGGQYHTDCKGHWDTCNCDVLFVAVQVQLKWITHLIFQNGLTVQSCRPFCMFSSRNWPKRTITVH